MGLMKFICGLLLFLLALTVWPVALMLVIAGGLRDLPPGDSAIRPPQ